ncbi:hypothetical protein PR048_023117, partial [Dryococelus australis]
MWDIQNRMSEKKNQIKEQNIRPERTRWIQKQKNHDKMETPQGRSERQNNKPKWLEDFISLNSELLTYEDAMNSNDKTNWEIATN